MKRITVQQALSLIAGQAELHCMLANPVTQPGFLTVGWSKEHESAVESIETADELYLLTERESFCSHRLLCVRPKGKYPDEQIYMRFEPAR